MNDSELANYFIYLQFITKKIEGFFENQKEYIACHKGCSRCCQNAQFPYTEVEFRFLIKGLDTLRKDVRETIIHNANILLDEKIEFLKTNPTENFLHKCPFLINNSCAVYLFRGIICRSFGLMYFSPDSPEKSKIPFCAFEGLNYSKVLDTNTKTISEEKFLEMNYKEKPKAFNVSYSTLTDDDFAKGFGFEFGDLRPLIDWFKIIPQE